MKMDADWEQNAEFWIKIIRDRLDPFRTELTDRAVLRAVGKCGDKQVLDAGCGEGYLARLMAKRGARVVGVDSSERLISAAQETERAQPQGIDFVVADFARTEFGDANFDIIVSNHSINDVRSPRQAFREFSRLLRPSGELVILMLHPCFYTGRGGENSAQVDVNLYFSLRRIRQRFIVSGVTSPTPVTAWLRPLEYYISSIAQEGFVVTRLEEPHPAPRQLGASEWWKSNFRRPLFLLIKARKEH